MRIANLLKKAKTLGFIRRKLPRPNQKNRSPPKSQIIKALPKVKYEKMLEHMYMTDRRMDRASPASLLSEKYSDPNIWRKYQGRIERAWYSRKVVPVRNGGYRLFLDVKDMAGWVDGQKTSRLEVRFDAKGQWHWFPVLVPN
jgi:hypothetical protein